MAEFISILVTCAACALLGLVLTDIVETVVIARRTRRTRGLTRLFYQVTWAFFSKLARRIKSGKKRERFLGIYGPTSLILLLGCWVVALATAFAMLEWAVGLQLNGTRANLLADLYFSAAALFTMTPEEPWNMGSKFLSVLEAGIGFSMLGLVIGYLPVLYQSFSSREVEISLLDARAGSPPSAVELVRREGTNAARLEKQLAKWENWAAELLETHIAYPMLAYFRSQHTNQSWLAALTSIIDASLLVIVAGDGDLKRQAELTFAMARHALVDLATIFGTPPEKDLNRLPAGAFSQLRGILSSDTTVIRAEHITENTVNELQNLYEPYAQALALHFLMALPAWIPPSGATDNWQTTRWGRTANPFAVSDPFRVHADDD